MTYQIFVRPEALDDLRKWMATLDHEMITPWLEGRVRLVNQSTSEWVVINVDENTWQTIRDNFPSNKVVKNSKF